jgi:hypothetical protein
MNSKIIYGLIFLFLIITSIFFLFYWSGNEEKKMKSHLTIYLRPPLLDGGGTVFVLPKPIPVEQWRQNTGFPNPALEDEWLKINKPIPQTDRRLGVVLSDSISIVQFDYPENGTFHFNFMPHPAFNNFWDTLKTENVGVGQAGDIYAPTRQEEDIPLVMTIHVLGSAKSNTGKEYVDHKIRLNHKMRLGFLKIRYKCNEFEHALACDALEPLDKR